MIIGGQAVLIYGEPRFTKDIDITLGIGPEKYEKILEIIQKLKLKVLVENIEEFVNKTMVLPAIDEKSGIRVDFIFSNSNYEKKAIERAKKIFLGKTELKFASLEDLIIHKIIAGRPRDIEDVKKILLKNPNFDLDYILFILNDFDKSLSENFCYIFKNLLKEIGLK